MNKKHILSLLLIILVLISSTGVFADELTPAWNLSGINKLHEKIIVNLNLKGAEEFNIDADEIRKIIRSTLSIVNVDVNGSETMLPMLGVSISGISSGGGGARYTIEVYVRDTIKSPYAKDRSIQIILWYGVASAEDNLRYDVISKGLVKPTGSIKDRVYNTVRAVASRLSSDFKKARSLSDLANRFLNQFFGKSLKIVNI